MHQRRRSNQRVALRARIRHMELSAGPRDLSVDIENAPVELNDNDLLQRRSILKTPISSSMRVMVER
jgi:hypothetical protein